MKYIAFVPFLLALGHGSLQGKTVTYSRLAIPFPAEISELSRNDRGAELVHSSYKDAARIILYPSVEVRGDDFQVKLDRLAAGINKGWKSEKVLFRQMGRTSKGYAFAMLNELVSAPDGKRIRILMAVATGSEMQVSSIYSVSEPAAKALIPILTQALDRATLQFPEGRGAAFSGATKGGNIMHLRYKVLAGMEPTEPERLNDMGYNYLAKDGKTELVVRVNLQSLIPHDGRQALAQWLTVAEFGQSKRWNIKGWDLAETEDFQLPSGQLVSSLGIRGKNRDGYVMTKMGYVVYGDGWSALVATGIEYSYPADYKYLETLLANEMKPLLQAIAGSVGWGAEPRKDDEATRYLVKKGTYRYTYEYLSVSNSMTSNFSFNSNKKEYWDFYSDGSCKYDSDSFTGMSSYDSGPSGTGVDGFGTSLASKEKVMKGEAWFQVISHNGVRAIMAQFPNGYTTLHLLELNKAGKIHDQRFSGLAIDGRIEGKYYKGKDYYYRE